MSEILSSGLEGIIAVLIGLFFVRRIIVDGTTRDLKRENPTRDSLISSSAFDRHLVGRAEAEREEQEADEEEDDEAEETEAESTPTDAAAPSPALTMSFEEAVAYFRDRPLTAVPRSPGEVPTVSGVTSGRNIDSRVHQYVNPPLDAGVFQRILPPHAIRDAVRDAVAQQDARVNALVGRTLRPAPPPPAVYVQQVVRRQPQLAQHLIRQLQDGLEDVTEKFEDILELFGLAEENPEEGPTIEQLSRNFTEFSSLLRSTSADFSSLQRLFQTVGDKPDTDKAKEKPTGDAPAIPAHVVGRRIANRMKQRMRKPSQHGDTDSDGSQESSEHPLQAQASPDSAG